MLYFAGGQILKALACEKATRGKVAFFFVYCNQRPIIAVCLPPEHKP